MNTTNPMMSGGMMYGTNFVDILFRHLMDHGWAGLSVMTLVQFYMYLSLDKIKTLFSNLNDKVAQKTTSYMEEKGYKYWDDAKNKASNVLSRLKRPQPHPMQEISEEVSEYRYKVALNLENKVDLMALGNFLMSEKNKTFVSSACHRITSDRYKAVEEYILPTTITIPGETTITLEQNVNLKFDCEVDLNSEHLKDVTFDKKKQDKITHTFTAHNDFEDIRSVNFDSWGAPYFIVNNWHCDPKHLFNGSYSNLLKFLYYTQNIDTVIRLIKYQRGTEEPFYYKGRTYTKSIQYPDLNRAFIDDKVLEEFKVELEEYCKKIRVLAEGKAGKIDLEKLVKEHAHSFDPPDNVVLGVNLFFANADSDPKQLAEYSRTFMHNLISDYYQRDVREGEKVSIYQLNIEYNTETTQKENPKYTKWKKKQGEKKEKKEKSEEKEAPAPNPMAEMFMGMRDHGPVKPKKWLREKITTPLVAAKHIKSDRKPMKYLYLPHDQKHSLESYLTNFKDNRELYNTMGIPYKGGIILSGEPGCGKSSSILAIATYLNKNIYFLDLGKIKTNEELKLCVDHVGSTSQKGGVIIFEDIDCMTNVVKKRTDDTVVNGEGLTLSFMLNILDGTMSPEDVIFIMTTNHPEVLDPALIRPGRMDLSIELKKCSREQVAEIYYDLYKSRLSQDILDRFQETFITSEVIMHLFHNVFNKEITQEELLKKFLKEPSLL